MIPGLQALSFVFLLLTPMVSAPPAFTQFTYCRGNPTASLESLCIQLNPAGVGETRFKRVEGEDLLFPIKLSPAGNSQFLKLLSGTKYLANAASYESGKKVADLGKKHMILEIDAGRREAEFNYSDMKDVNALVAFFEGLVTQEVLVLDVEWALKYDLLGVPERLDQIEALLKQNRLVDPKIMLDVLDMVDRDEHIVNYARDHAKDLKAKIHAIK